MKRKRNTNHKGGKLPSGEMNRSSNPSQNAGIALTKEVRDAIASLPQIKSGEWSKSYLTEQIYRNLLGLSADYTLTDLDVVFNGKILE